VLQHDVAQVACAAQQEVGADGQGNLFQLATVFDDR
jgi:hypothetical protein